MSKPYTIGKFMDFFDDLKSEIVWERRDDAPRTESWMMLDGLRSYTYGRGRGERTYEAHPFTPLVLNIANALGQMLHEPTPRGCFANLYLNSRDHLGWHADADPKIDHTRPIVSVSFGEERAIQFRPMPPVGVKRNAWADHGYVEKIEELVMKSGSVTVMPAGYQFTHQHQIPKVDHNIGERISLTYRWLL